MRALLSLLVLTGLVACDPPPEISANTDDSNEPVDATPSISFLFPQTSNDLVYCSSFMAVVDVDNFEIYPDPYEDGLQLADGQGHWHLIIPAGLGGGFALASEAYVAIDLSDQDPDPDTRYLFEATLVDNAHAPVPGVASAVAEIRIDDDFMVDGDTGQVPGCLGGGAGSSSMYP